MSKKIENIRNIAEIIAFACVGIYFLFEFSLNPEDTTNLSLSPKY